MGFSTRGAEIVNDVYKPPEPDYVAIQEREQRERAILEEISRVQTQRNNEGGGAPDMRRHFEFERNQYPWKPHSGYEDLGQIGNNNVRRAPWGREYTDHAIEATLPSGQRFNAKENTVDYSFNRIEKYDVDDRRSVPPSYIERTICYGEKRVDDKGRVSYTLGDVIVGVTSDEKRVYHVRYEHD